MTRVKGRQWGARLLDILTYSHSQYTHTPSYTVRILVVLVTRLGLLVTEVKLGTLGVARSG